MVRSWVCPQCLGDLDAFYIEEGSTRVTSQRIVCPRCGFSLEGSMDEGCGEGCPDLFEQERHPPASEPSTRPFSSEASSSGR